MGSRSNFSSTTIDFKNFNLSDYNEYSPEFVHIVTEATKLAFADREAFYGDPDFVEIPTKILLGQNYNKERAKLITDKASLEVRPGKIEGFGGPVIVRKKVKQIIKL